MIAHLILTVFALQSAAQAAPPARSNSPDTPALKVGATIFADYTIQQQPKITDADGNEVTSNAFNVGRAYINVTGNLSHIIAFRVTPDIARESGTGSSLDGSLTFRLKYAYAQFNLDDWVNRGTWVRLGMQQTPWVDFMENVWRYRFQGTIFEDREGFLSSSDVGASFRYNLPGNFGDAHTGFYNGDTYSRPEANDQKAFMIRGSLRPLPRHALLRGLRLTWFYDKDAYVKNAERERAIAAVTFEHPRLNAAFDYLATTDQPRASAPEIDGRGFSVWATPRFARGWEAIARMDRLEPNTDLDARKTRLLGGISYWFALQGPVATALLFDVENVKYEDYAPTRPNERRFALHMVVNF